MHNEPNPCCGYLYVAAGEKYLKEAALSRRSLRELDPSAKATLVTNEPYSEAGWDQVEVIDFHPPPNSSWKEWLRLKIQGFQASPYEKTVFADSDTFHVEDTSHLFTLLDHFDILICHDYHDRALIPSPRTGKSLMGYVPYNTGFVAFKKSERVEAFLKAWAASYDRSFDDHWSDQPAFMDAMLEVPVNVYVLDPSYNFRYATYASFPADTKVRLIHGRGSYEDFRNVERRVNRTREHRCWVAHRRRCYGWNDYGLFEKLWHKGKSLLIRAKDALQTNRVKRGRT